MPSHLPREPHPVTFALCSKEHFQLPEEDAQLLRTLATALEACGGSER
jgi:hypothetical protein